MDQKIIFKQFLHKHFPDNIDALIQKFEAYHSWLVEENAKINLISRQVDPDNIWTAHFLDSLLSIQYVDFNGRDTLDFGTGGGLPGIPIAILYRGAKVTLLDSKKKKIAAARRAVEMLELKNCDFIDKRIEELTPGPGTGRPQSLAFDIIVSRSVKIDPRYKPVLLNCLNRNGKIVLYKSKILDDVCQFDNDKVQIFDADNPAVGERKIVVIKKH